MSFLPVQLGFYFNQYTTLGKFYNDNVKKLETPEEMLLLSNFSKKETMFCENPGRKQNKTMCAGQFKLETPKKTAQNKK